MALMRSYRTLEEFEREEIRPSYRIGFSMDDIEESGFEAELCFDEQGGFEVDSYEGDEDEDTEDEDEDDTEDADS